MWHRDSRDADADADQAPLVGRPRGPLWRALQADGVVWEGQVLLVGAEVDLAARVIVTQHRLAFARGGGLVLDVPRAWLQPAPVVRPDGTLLLSIRTDGEEGAGTERVLLRTRDGHPDTFYLLDLLGGGTPRGGDAVLPVDAQRRPSVLPPLPEPAPAAPDPARRPVAGRGPTAPLPISPLDPFGALPAGAVTTASASGSVLEPVVRPAAPPAAIGRDRDWNLQPIRDLVPQARRRRRGWGLRLTGLLVLLAGAYVGITQVPSRPGDRAAIDLPPATGASGTTVAGLLPPTATAPLTAAEQTALAVGVGVGGLQATADAVASAAPPTATATAPSGPTATPRPTATRGRSTTAPAASGPTEPAAPDPMPTPSPDPTATTAPQPTATPMPDPSPTAAPTAAPTATVTATSAPSPTASPPPITAPAPTMTPAPTATPPTPSPTAPAPTTAPAALDPTTAPPPTATNPPAPNPSATVVPPTETPTAPATAAPDRVATAAPPAAPTQAASVGVNQVPNQVVTAGPLRYTVEAAQRGAPLPRFSLPPTVKEEWIALIVRVRNTGDAATELETDDLALRTEPSGETVELYGGTGAVASQLGLDTPFEPGETIRFNPGQERRLAAVFRVPADAEGATLLIGDAALDLAPALATARAGDGPDPAAEAAAPDLVEATVTRIVDGERIEVALGEARVQVRYLGVDAPTGDRCYAAESTAANAALVEGETVWLERQRSDADVLGNLLRDVWIDDGEGGRDLVAARLAAEGAVRANPDGGNVRYAGWIAAAAAAAEAEGAGLWGACPAASAEEPAPAAALARPFALGPWWTRGD